MVRFIFSENLRILQKEYTMKDPNNEKSVVAALEDVAFILNEIKHKKFQELRKTKLNPAQEKILTQIEKDIDVCVTKIGLLLHPTEL